MEFDKESDAIQKLLEMDNGYTIECVENKFKIVKNEINEDEIISKEENFYIESDGSEGIVAKSKVVYGDSIMPYEAITLKKGNRIFVRRMDQVAEETWKPYRQFKPNEEDIYSKQQNKCEAHIMTSSGWKGIRRIIRHRTRKRLFQVSTNKGVVTVTEDHSLLRKNGEKIKPKDLEIGTELMHRKIDGMIDTIRRKYYTDPVEAQRFYLSLKNRDYVHIKHRNGIYSFEHKDYKPTDEIVDISELNYCDYDDFVYDIETIDGTFHAGVGNMIVKNTDSIYTIFTLPDQDKLSKEETLQKIWEVSEECADRISETFKKPIELEMEKIMWPLYLYGKKRYANLYYEKNKDNTFSCKKDFKGIQIVRRDNCKLVKTICEPIFDKLLYDMDVDGAKNIARKWIKDLLENKISIDELVLSKSLKSHYKEVNKAGNKLSKPAHWFLAEKMRKRDPANYPKPGDRVPFIFIENPDKNALQQDRVEDPEYIKEHPGECKPDALYYLDRQIASPLYTIFELLVKDRNGKLFPRKIKNDGSMEISKECKTEISRILWKRERQRRINRQNGNREISDFFKIVKKDK